MQKSFLGFNNNLKLSEKARVLKHLAMLLKSGIPTVKSISIAASSQRKHIKKRLLSVISGIEGGKTLSHSLEDEGLILKSSRPSVEAAEQNAFLEEALMRTSEIYEKKCEFSKTIKNSLSYPAVVLAFSLLSIIATSIFITPAYAQMFSDLNAQVPLPAKIMIIAMNYFWLAAAGFAMFLALVILKMQKDRDFTLKIPIANSIYRLMLASDFCYSLSYQLKNGVPIVSALRKTSFESKRLNSQILQSASQIEQGAALSSAFSSINLFEKSFMQFVHVGGESGNLSNVLWYAGGQYMLEAEDLLGKYARMAGPCATLVVGSIVGFVALSMVMPLFSAINSLI